jgi:uncharacterized DUF497 family protein
MAETRKIFEWDERKRRSNLRKHGLDFVECAAVFAGLTITQVDSRCDYGETRFVTVGLLGGRVVSVIHTESEEFVRIISFRKATKNEQARYFKAIKDGLEAC